MTHARPGGKFQFSVRGLLVSIAILAIWLAYFTWSQRLWSDTRRANAEWSYRTMRGNLESYGEQLTDAQHRQLRQGIEDQWQKDYPDLPIPAYP